MILDAETLELSNSIETVLEAATPDELTGEVKPELMESVLEIATQPCRTTAEAGEQLRGLRRLVREVAGENGLAIGAAGTHPFAMWEDQRIVARPRYRDLINALRFVARQEIIFGVHVHVGLDDPDKAIHVANGMRVHVPVLLALSANSPFWRADATGLHSTRTPIFRAFPRVGIPPTYRDWADYERRIEFMVESGTIEDYTYLWYDVRPHPNFGTVEVRVIDAQTRVEHTLALAALVQAMVKELAEHFDAGKSLSRYPFEMLDENKWLAVRHGLDGELTMRLLEHGADIDHRVDVLVRRGVCPHRRVGCSGQKVAQGPDAGGRRGGILRAGKGEDAPAAVRLDRVAEVNRLGVGQTDDRRGMKAHADLKTLGQMLMGCLAGEDRGSVTGRGPRRVAPVPHKVALRLGRIEPFARCEQGGPFAVEVDQFLGDGLAFRRIAMQEAGRAALPQHRRQLPSEIEAVLHRHVHALARFRAVGVAGVAGDEHARQTHRDLLVRHVIEPVAEALADLIDRPPRHFFHVERIGPENAPRRSDQIVSRDVAI